MPHEWRKNKKHLTEHTGYPVAGSIITGAKFLLYWSATNSHTYKIKIIWILISIPVWLLLLFREFEDACLLRLNLIPHWVSTEGLCGQLLGEINKGENVRQQIIDTIIIIIIIMQNKEYKTVILQYKTHLSENDWQKAVSTEDSTDSQTKETTRGALCTIKPNDMQRKTFHTAGHM